jgi:hypothetical protein
VVSELTTVLSPRWRGIALGAPVDRHGRRDIEGGGCWANVKPEHEVGAGQVSSLQEVGVELEREADTGPMWSAWEVDIGPVWSAQEAGVQKLGWPRARIHELCVMDAPTTTAKLHGVAKIVVPSMKASPAARRKRI